MINVTISDQAAGMLIYLFFILGVAFSAHLLLEAIKWLITRKKRKKYRLTQIWNCDHLTISGENQESSQ